MMKLTLPNLIYISKEYTENKNIQETYSINEFIGEGDDAVNYLLYLSKKFNVTFEEFDFEQYFTSEAEINKKLSWFGLRKNERVKENLIVYDLFHYMKNHLVIIQVLNIESLLYESRILFNNINLNSDSFITDFIEEENSAKQYFHHLELKFQVSFDRLEIKKYFYTFNELNNIPIIDKITKTIHKKEKMSINDLLLYMENNRKDAYLLNEYE